MEFATSASLLIRLKSIEDEDAWDEFYRLYSPLILSFARQRGCTPTTAADVLQETMVRLLRSFPEFSYHPEMGKFRSFLLRIVDARISDAFRRSRAREKLAQRAGVESEPPGATPSEEPAPGADWDRLWDKNLLLQAFDRVKRKVQPNTFESFDLYVLQELPIKDVQGRTGIPPNVIYQHRNRVLKLMRKEVELLKSELGE